MKRLAFAIFGFFLLLGFNTNAVASNYLGNVCFDFHLTDSSRGPINIKFNAEMEISEVGGHKHYSVFILTQRTGDNPLLFNGVGKIVGNDLFITTSGTRDQLKGAGGGAAGSNERAAVLMEIRINLLTSEGTVWMTAQTWNLDDKEWIFHYQGGSAKLNGCK